MVSLRVFLGQKLINVYKPMIDTDIFGDVDKSKLRLAKPANGTPKAN
jgi:hypothetical protein